KTDATIHGFLDCFTLFAMTFVSGICLFYIGFDDSFARRTKDDKMFHAITRKQYSFSSRVYGQDFDNLKAAFVGGDHGSRAKTKPFQDKRKPAHQSQNENQRRNEFKVIN